MFSGEQNGARDEGEVLVQMAKAPLGEVALGADEPVLVWVETEAVTAKGAGERVVGVPEMVVRTGVMVLGLPDSLTETQGARAPVGVGEGVGAVGWVEVDERESWDCRAKRGRGSWRPRQR